MAEQIIRSIPLIQRYARNNEAEDARFRGWLKGYCSLSNRDLDKVVQEVTDAVWSEIDCLECANCCKTLQPSVDEEDISRLAKRLKLTTKEFRDKYTKLDEDKQRILATTPCRFLGADNRCTVYEDRPKACHDFPYLHQADFRSRSITMMLNCEVCPIVFNTWNTMKQKLGYHDPKRKKP